MRDGVSARQGRRLRLGVDLHTFDGIYQGSRSHLLGLYGEAIRQAPDIDFFFFLAQPAVLATEHPVFASANVTLVSMAHRSGAWRLVWQLGALQRRHRLDLLHLQYRLPLLRSGACMCTVHDVLFETHPEYFGAAFARIARLSSTHAVRHSRILCTVSDYSRRQIAAHYRVDPAQIVLTPNAVDSERFHPARDAAGDARVLDRWQLAAGGYVCTLGRLEPRKNHRHLVDAYARLPEHAPPLLIIGQRDFAYAEIFEAIERHRLQQRVRLLENVDDAALPVVLRHARLMIYPSRAEGFGMPLLEALASGVPVVTSDTTSLPEVAGAAAWIVRPDDVGQLAQTIGLALAEGAAARGARIDAGLAHAANFNWRHSAAALLTAVRRCRDTGNQ